MPPPTVTVIVPCFNHGRFVAEAVRSALAQPGAGVRVVVVDDGSTDGVTPGLCDECLSLPGAAGRVGVIHQANTGLPGARNAGALGAQTEYVLPLDADDYLEPTGIADLIAAVEAEDASGRGGDVSHAYGQQRMADLGHGVWAVPDWDPVLLGVTNLHPPTALIRRSAFEAVGGYTASMTTGYEDWDLWLKFAERGMRGVRVRRPVYVWRRHSTHTMIHDAIRRHDEIYASIVRQHPAFFERHATALLLRANAVLRRADANWLDENLESIWVRDARRWLAELVPERDSARAERDAALAECAALRARLEAAGLELRRAVEGYEAKPAVRLSRVVHRAVEALPTPVAAAARGVLRAIKGAAPR